MRCIAGILVLFVLTILVLLSCQSQNPMSPLQSGVPQLSFSEEKIAMESGEYTYLQNIRVECTQSGALQFAFQPQYLSGKAYPAYQTNAEGWILFGKDNVWTNKSGLDFAFDSVEGALQNMVTEIAVRVRYPDGTIRDLSSAFKSSRVLGSYLENAISPGAELSAGIEFHLREASGDIFVDGMYADHFMYRVNILDSNLNQINSGEWFSSLNCPDIRKIHLSLSTSPALDYNDQDTYTQFEYYVVSRSGVEQAEPGSIHFRVLEGFKPVAVIYPQTLAGLGTYHYGFNPDMIMDNRQLIPGDGERFCRALWDTGGMLTAINSPDFKLHLHWGYRGMYYDRVSNMPTDNPLVGVPANTVLDPEGVNYGSSVVAFWLQLDHEAFPLKPHQQLGSQVLMDDEGQIWTRALNLNHSFRHIVLEGLGNGLHKFRVMAEDLQGVTSDPVEVMVNLIPLKPVTQRSGVLIVDNDPHSPAVSPNSYVNDFYQSLCPVYMGSVTHISFGSTDFLNPTQLMNYSAVMIHADNYNSNPDLNMMYEGLDVYLKNQGNLILSSTQKLKSALQVLQASPGGPAFLSNRLGILNADELGTVSSSMATNNYFQSAVGLQGLPHIPLNIEHAFNAVVSARHGISCVTFFEPDQNLDYIYALGCKPVGYDNFAPTQEQYDFYSSKYVAYRHMAQGSKVYVFGFPISYMTQIPMANAMEMIFSEISGSMAAQGRNK